MFKHFIRVNIISLNANYCYNVIVRSLDIDTQFKHHEKFKDI